MRVKDVLFPMGEAHFVPAYFIELWIRDYPAFSYVVDAVDAPDVLFRKNLTSRVTFKYRVHNTGDETAISIHVYGTDVTRIGSSVRRYYD